MPAQANSSYRPWGIPGPVGKFQATLGEHWPVFSTEAFSIVFPQSSASVKSKMRNPGKAPRISSYNRLLNLTRDFADAQAACDLLDEFLTYKSFDRSFCVKLFAVARQGQDVVRTGGGAGLSWERGHPACNEAGLPGRKSPGLPMIRAGGAASGSDNYQEIRPLRQAVLTSASWDVRRLAILMLEHQILKLSVDDCDEFDFLFTELRLKQGSGLASGIVKSVLREGFSTTEPRAFIHEFLRKLERLSRVHRKIQGKRTSQQSLSEFLRLSRHDCKLSLARYLFTPDEVVDEILQQLQITEGATDLNGSEPRQVLDQIKRTLNSLPDFEARILKRLCRASDIYWVADDTSSEINSLVEYPVTTVVVVIKPPGSDVEFELKRAGRKGPNSLRVVYARNGYTVPPSHRLDGGSMQWLLRYETKNACKLAAIYRLVHKTDAPMSNYISRSTIYSIPFRDDKARTLTYFTHPHVFGADYRRMRVALKESVDAFTSEGTANLPHLPGDLGLTAQFIGHVAPAQAILSGTTSFRLDKLATYLSSKGPEVYFKQILQGDYSRHDARIFADTLLEEVLGCYAPPAAAYRNHDQYLKAAFAVADNRARADGIYLSLLEQIGKFWGTLLAVRGYTRGESFVARNVGLRSFWDSGRWNVKIIFMDHDALVIPNSPSGRFFAYGDVPNMVMDERYIWGNPSAKKSFVSEVGCLQSIYKVSAALAAQGQALAKKALKEAYKATQEAMRTNAELRSFFSKGVVEKLLDWDTLVSGYLRLNGDESAVTAWKKKMRKLLATKGYQDDAFDVYLEVMDKYRGFLERQSFLFDLETEKPRAKRQAS